MRPASLRLNVRVFSVFIIVGVLMLAVASYLVIGMGQARLRNAWGQHLQQVADQTAAAVDTYVFRLVIDASVLASVPDIRETAAEGSARPFDRDAAAAIDRDWQRSGPPAAARDIAVNKASLFLAEVMRSNSIYRELLLTDRQGRVVATSGPTAAYLHTDAPWWRAAFADGNRGRLFVRDVKMEAGATTRAIEVTAPVTDPAGTQVAGLLRAMVDMRELGTVLGGVRMGTTGDSALVHEDGTFVFASSADVDPNARFFAANLLREHLAAVKKGEPQSPVYFGASTTDGTKRLVGVAMSQLKATFPDLKWAVAVSQGEEEVFAPVRGQAASLLLVIGLIVVAVLLFGVWYSVRLAAPPEPEEMDMHLVRHPPAHWIEEPEASEQAAEKV